MALSAVKNTLAISQKAKYYDEKWINRRPSLVRPLVPSARAPRSKPLHAIEKTFLVAVLLATVFVAWTPTNFSVSSFSDKLALLLTPQPVIVNQAAGPAQQALRIGIVAGHSGNDSGAVCVDTNGKVTLTEAEVNLKIATLVQKKLVERGFQVDLLNEFDPRLNGYRGVAMVSIHNDSCQYINDQATGFKVAAALNTRDSQRAGRLLSCLVDRYQTRHRPEVPSRQHHRRYDRLPRLLRDRPEYDRRHHRDRLPQPRPGDPDPAHRSGRGRSHTRHPVLCGQRKRRADPHANLAAMNPPLDEAHLAVQNARNALRENRRTEARQWAERAASLAPQLEDSWLILAAIASPRASVEYIQKAQQINPDSPRARRGMEWAMQRLRVDSEQRAIPPGAQGTSPNEPAGVPVSRLPAAAPAASATPTPSRPAAPPRPRGKMPFLLIGIGLLVCMLAGISAVMSPALASFLHTSAAPRPLSWAQAPIPKPTYTPASPLALNVQATSGISLSATPEASAEADATLAPDQPTESAASQPAEQPTGQPTEEFPPTAEPTWSGSLSLEFVNSTPVTSSTSQAAAPEATPVPGYSASSGEHWIDVDLTHQMVYAYDGNNVANSFLVSTGLWGTPTVTGKYHIYVKLRYTDMSGPGYYLPDVPYTMYFFQSYGLHGTYWHHNFGTPMSHGCVNLSIPDAEWLYNFASVGTLVNVHY